MINESKPGLIEVNLQHFAEGEETVDTSVETVDTSVESTPADEPFGGSELADEQPETEFDFSPFLDKLNDGRMQYNKEAAQVESLDQLIEFAQKGMNYDKVTQTKSEIEQQLAAAQNDPHLAFYKDLAKRYGYDDLGKYEEAVKAQWEQDEINKLIQANVPEEYAREMLENKKFREQYGQEKEQREAQDKETAMYNEFIETFPGVDANNIPPEVWEMVNKGRDLTSAYAIHAAKNIDTVKTDAQQEAIKALTQNAETSSGSVTEQTTQAPAAMTAEQINATLNGMTTSQQREWVDKNYDAIEKSGYFEKF